jgi:hypothetical protein
LPRPALSLKLDSLGAKRKEVMLIMAIDAALLAVLWLVAMLSRELNRR